MVVLQEDPPARMSLFRRGDDSDSEDEGDAVNGGAERATAATDNGTPLSNAGSDSDGEGDLGMLGDMLKLEEGAAAGESSSGAQPGDSSTNTTVTVRSFPLPKHMPSSTIMPKKLLAEVLMSAGNTNAERAAAKGKAKDLHAICEYREISGGSRAHRVHLEISWVKGKVESRGKGGSSGTSRQGTRNTTPARTPPPPALWPDQDQSLVTFTRKKKLLNGGAAGPTSGEASSTAAEEKDAAGPAVPSNAAAPPSSSTIPSPASQAPTRSANVAHYLEYKMFTLGCPSAAEAENYASTIALHQLTTGTNHCASKELGLVAEPADGAPSESADRPQSLPARYPAINAKNLPLVYRDLWDELEAVRIEREDEDKRRFWAQLESLANGESSQPESQDSIGAIESNGKAERAGDDAQESGRPHVAGRRSNVEFIPAIQEQWDRRIASPQFQKMQVRRVSGQ